MRRWWRCPVDSEFLIDVHAARMYGERDGDCFNSIQEAWAFMQLEVDKLRYMCEMRPQEIDPNKLRQVFINISAMGWRGARAADLEQKPSCRTGSDI